MGRVTVRVPATSANLGPGFDSFGCAMALYNTYTFETISGGLEIFGCPEEFRNRDNLAVVAYRYAMEALGLEPEPLRLDIAADIPVCRGLGSSSAMIIGGMMAANALHGSPLDKAEMLRLCTVVEGHPDNLAPALYGGMTASLMRDGRPVTARFHLSEKLRFLALVPDFPLSTQLARSVLPQRVPFADAVFNVSHAALLLRALETADTDMIALALDDRLHQPYRRSLIAGIDLAEQTARECGVTAFCISGAGPTCLCIADNDDIGERLKVRLPEVLPNWQVLALRLDTEGATILPDAQAIRAE